MDMSLTSEIYGGSARAGGISDVGFVPTVTLLDVALNAHHSLSAMMTPSGSVATSSGPFYSIDTVWLWPASDANYEKTAFAAGIPRDS